jgi:hypothetical protein
VQRDLILTSCKRMGKEGKFGRMQAITPGGKRITLVYFGSVDDFLCDMDEMHDNAAEPLLRGNAQVKVNCVYQLGINSYQGKEELQYSLKSYK